MFRRINLKDNNEDFKATLWKNRREPLGLIDNSYIKTVKRSFQDIDEFSLEIPKYIQRNDKKIINPLYLKIQARQQIIVETTVAGEIKKERFIITEPKRKGSKYNGGKTFKALSFESTLKDKRTSFDGKVIQLKKDNVHIAEGIMDKFARETGWSVDYVDPKARVETMSTMELVNVDLFSNFTSSTVNNNGLIFEKNITTSILNDRPLYISFEYTNLNIIDSGKSLLKIPTISNTLTDALHKNIKKVQAYHYSDVGNRYGIRYVFTLTDNTIVERVAVFTNVINKKFTCENIRLVWETGNIIETENVKYINIESLDTDWYSALRDLQDKFNSIFLFDSYNKSISVISRKTLEQDDNLSPYVLTYDNAILDVEVDETQELITGLKVIGKDGLSIVSENIYGDDIVRDYSEYIRRGIISDELKNALERYETVLTTKQEEWLNIKNSVLDETQRQVRIDSEIKTLQERIKNLKNLLAGFISGGDTVNQSRIKSEIDGLETRLNECLALHTQYFNNIQTLNDELSLISQEIDKKNVVDNQGKIFTDLDLEELNDIEVVKVFEDDYYSSSFALLNVAKKTLAEMIEPQIDFKINCANLCKLIQNKNGWNYVLSLGSLFKLKDVDVFNELVDEGSLKQDFSIRLIGYDYDPKENKISSLIFTNKVEKINVERSLANLGKKNNANTDLLKNYRQIFEDAKLSNNFAKEILEKGLDLSAYIARGRGISNYIDISEAGIYLYDQSDMNKCVYIGSSLICISQDGFATSETAISSEGIFAKLLVGSVILGEKLYITSENGEFYIGNMDEKQGFGLSIKDSIEAGQKQRIFLGTEVDSDGVRRAKLRLAGKDGEFALTEEGMVSEYQYNDRSHIDPEAPFYSYLRLRNNISKIKEGILTIKFLPFRTYSKGLEYDGGYVSSVTSSSGGSYSSTSSSGGGYYNTVSSETNTELGHRATTERQVSWSDSSSIDIVDGMTLHMDKFGHRHDYYYYSKSHSHLISLSINGHSHQFAIPNHSHTVNLNIGKHSHQEKYGCFDLSGDDNKPTNVSLYVNGQRILTGINSDREVDISAYLIKNQVNEIKFTSSTRGIIHINCYVKSFVLF